MTIMKTCAPGERDRHSDRHRIVFTINDRVPTPAEGRRLFAQLRTEIAAKVGWSDNTINENIIEYPLMAVVVTGMAVGELGDVLTGMTRNLGADFGFHATTYADGGDPFIVNPAAEHTWGDDGEETWAEQYVTPDQAVVAITMAPIFDETRWAILVYSLGDGFIIIVRPPGWQIDQPQLASSFINNNSVEYLFDGQDRTRLINYVVDTANRLARNAG